MKTVLKEGLNEIKKDVEEGNAKKQIANLLTASRLLAPFVFIPLIYYNHFFLFSLMVILFSLTDALDGYFARKYNAVSTFGAYLDAVVDKVFALSLLIPIIIKTTLTNSNFSFVFLCILLELVIGLLNLYSFLKNLNPKSTIYGKIKTVFLFILLGLFYLNQVIEVKDIYLFLFIIITNIMQFVAILSYLLQIKKRKIFINSSL